MEELSLIQIKEIEICLLNEIDKVCKDNDIKYSLCAGTLLGAIRHKGFIPWDDDIDIMMLRSDYNKFISYCCLNHEILPFDILCHENNDNYGKLYAKVIDKNTVITDSIVVDSSSLGLFVDVFPVDYLDDDYIKSVKKLNKSSFLRRLLLAKQWKRFYRNKNIPFYYEPLRLLIYFVSKMFSMNFLINRIEKRFSRTRCNYSACICGSYGEKEVLNTSVFENMTIVEFEGQLYSAFKNYDDYLSSIYGDYMKLPPKDKQITHHTFKAYRV